jgi:glutamate-1-semialdehyde 2,1-aminomutase
VALGGAQELYGVTPDLTTLGKIIGGGFPVGAFGGKAEIMNQLAPTGPVYQAGTLSGNPIAMVAGMATVEALSQPGVYDELERKGKRLADGLCRAAGSAPIHVSCNRVGSMSTTFFTHLEVSNWSTASTSDTEKYAKFFRGMLDKGFWLAPSQFEACFVSAAHTDDEIDAFVEAAADVLKTL